MNNFFGGGGNFGGYDHGWLFDPGTETRGGQTTQTTTSAGQGVGQGIINELGEMKFNPYTGPNPFTGGTFTEPWKGALDAMGTTFTGPQGQWADSRNVYKDVYGRGAPATLGGPGASSFLTGFGGKGVADYQRALGFDRSGAEKQYTADAGRAMKQALIAENAKARGFGSGGRDVERGYDVRGEAYGNIASNVGRQMLGYDDRAREAAIRAMGQDIGRGDWRTQQDIANIRDQDMLAMKASQLASDPTNQLAYAGALGELGQYEQGLDIAGKNWLKGLHDEEQQWAPMIASLKAQTMGQTPWNTTTTGTTSESRPGQSPWDQILGTTSTVAGLLMALKGGGDGGGGGTA